jgi:hypothetical protein
VNNKKRKVIKTPGMKYNIIPFAVKAKKHEKPEKKNQNDLFCPI